MNTTSRESATSNACQKAWHMSIYTITAMPTKEQHISLRSVIKDGTGMVTPWIPRRSTVKRKTSVLVFWAARSNVLPRLLGHFPSWFAIGHDRCRAMTLLTFDLKQTNGLGPHTLWLWHCILYFLLDFNCQVYWCCFLYLYRVVIKIVKIYSAQCSR